MVCVGKMLLRALYETMSTIMRALSQLPHNSRGWSPGSSGSDQNLSCSERVQPPQNNTAEVPASSRGAVHHLRRHAYKQRDPVSRVEIDGDEMREPSGAGLRKSLYNQRMLPTCRHLAGDARAAAPTGAARPDVARRGGRRQPFTYDRGERASLLHAVWTKVPSQCGRGGALFEHM